MPIIIPIKGRGLLIRGLGYDYGMTIIRFQSWGCTFQYINHQEFYYQENRSLQRVSENGVFKCEQRAGILFPVRIGFGAVTQTLHFRSSCG